MIATAQNEHAQNEFDSRALVNCIIVRPRLLLLLPCGSVPVAQCLGASDANAFRTSDCDKPNCRAIREGVTPALNAERTALN